MGGSDKLLSIHYLRVIAALMVVCAHIFSYGLVAGYDENPVYRMKHGVSIFFVISGFVAVVSTEKLTNSGLDFLRRRLIRIAPIYWIATLIAVFGGFLTHTNEAELLPSLLFLPTQIAGEQELISPALEIGWTLCLEVAFYLLFSVAMNLPRRLAVIGTATVLCIVGIIGPVFADGPWTYFYCSPLVLEFGAGMILAWTGLKLPWWLCPIGFALLALPGGLTDNHTLSVSLPAVLIVAGARGLDGRLPTIPALMVLGDASYALYLFHLHVLALIIVPNLGHPAPAMLVLPAGFAVTILVSVLVHRHVEKPIAAAVATLFKPARTEKLAPA